LWQGAGTGSGTGAATVAATVANNGACSCAQDVLVTCPSRNETETGPWQIAHEAESPENTVK